MDDQRGPKPGAGAGVDLLSAALLVFFIALLVLVAALTLLPVILP